MGTGLTKLCKLYGAIIINGKRFVWDYVANVAVPEDEMPTGSKRWKASEKARWTKVKDEYIGV